jgi:ribosomal protein S12 methylthiotransferase
MSNRRNHTVALVSLGCLKNLVDSEVMLGLLERAGYDIVEDVADAETIIVNTCAFIREAKEEAIDALLEMSELKRTGSCRALVCVGCLTQRYCDSLARELPEVDGFLGTGSIPRIVEVVEAARAGKRPRALDEPFFLYSHDTPRVRTGPRWLGTIKIAEGCSNACSFCAIPALRGPLRSRPPDSVVAEFRALVADGVREVLLVAQDSTEYGTDLFAQPALARLLRQLGDVEFDGWIRLLYGHPYRVDRDLIEAVADVPAVVKYIDIPMQHASPAILEAMARPEGAEGNLELIRRIRARIPEAAIRSTFLVGFPGESEADFECLLDFVRAAEIDRVTTFVFSPEEGTPAAEMPDQVPLEVAEERAALLMAEQEPVSLRVNQRFVGRRMRVLVEERRGRDLMVGRTYRDAPEVDGEVLLTGTRAPVGEFVEVRITQAHAHDLEGEIA